MRSTVSATLLVGVVLLAPMAAIAQDKAVIQRLNDKFAADFNSGNFAAVASHYTEDAVLLPPGAEMVKGRSAIQSFWKSAAEGVSDLKLEAMDVKPLGTDAAREIGRLEARVSLPNPKTKTSAPPPLKTPTGGASPPADLTSLAKSDDATAYWKMREAQQKARA